MTQLKVTREYFFDVQEWGPEFAESDDELKRLLDGDSRLVEEFQTYIEDQVLPHSEFIEDPDIETREWIS